MINSIFETFLLLLRGWGTIIHFFYILGIFLLSGVAIGLLTGALIGTYYMYKEMKEDTKVEKDDHLDDDFFNDLIEK